MAVSPTQQPTHAREVPYMSAWITALTVTGTKNCHSGKNDMRQ